MSFSVPVRTSIPATQFKALNALAEQHRTTVSDLVAELVRRGMEPKQRRRGRPTTYTPEMGAQILEARRLHRSLTEIGAEQGIAATTAGTYLRRAEVEARAARLAALTESEKA